MKSLIKMFKKNKPEIVVCVIPEDKILTVLRLYDEHIQINSKTTIYKFWKYVYDIFPDYIGWQSEIDTQSIMKPKIIFTRFSR